MQKPSWCLVVNTMYCWPAPRARSTKWYGTNLVELEGRRKSRYWASEKPSGWGDMIGQEASTLAREYGPQWMNMPNLASRYHEVLSSAIAPASPKFGIRGRQDDSTATFMNSRRSRERAFLSVDALAEQFCMSRDERSLP